MHDELFSLEAETHLPIRISFIGLWCIADRAGRFKWEPRRIGAQVLPYDGTDFSRVLDALTSRGFVKKYASDDREFGYIPSFLKHQVINNKERDSELPDPLLVAETPTRDHRVNDASTTRDQSGKGEGKGREQGKEQGKEGKDSPPKAEGESNFAKFWQVYPKKKGMGNAEKIWKRDKLDAITEEIIEAVKIQRKSKDWIKDSGQFIPHPATWLNAKGWMDEQPQDKQQNNFGWDIPIVPQPPTQPETDDETTYEF